MDSNFASISQYYKCVITNVVDSKYQPLGRINFCFGAHLAVIFLIQKVAVSIFYIFLNVVTFGLKQNYRASLIENLREGLTSVGAIPVGLLGMLFPGTVNRHILDIPDEGILLPSL